MSKAYKSAGVDIHKGDKFVSLIAPFVKKTLNNKVQRVPSGYAGLYKISNNQYIAASTDGVGTKLKLAHLLGKHSTVGIDLVAMSVNDLVCVGATPLFFLDYFATGKLKVSTAVDVVKGIAQACQQTGMALVGGETAEMPGFYNNDEYDLAGFAVGLVDKSNLLTGSKVKTGDVLLGLASSGFHSNGYSLVRKYVRKTEKKLLSQCLVPTVLYVRAVQTLRSSLKTNLHGLCHITGGGFLNIPRLNEKFNYNINLSNGWSEPAVIKEIRERAKLSPADAFTTFNMGVGLVAAIAQEVLHTAGKRQQLFKKLKAAGYTPFILGTVGSKAKKNLGPVISLEQAPKYMGLPKQFHLEYGL